MAERIHEAAPRWTFRVAAEANSLVREAASASHRNLTQFVLDAAVHEAERVLADRKEFALPQDRWDEFLSQLERPVRENPGLAKLFERPSAFS